MVITEEGRTLGDTGPTGDTGPIGDTGLSGVSEAIQVELDSATSVTNTSNVIFNTVQNSVGTNISYNTTTGEFTISGEENYYVSWWIATNGASSSSTVEFELRLDGTRTATSGSLYTQGIISGDAIVTVSTAPGTLTLINNSADTVFFAGLSIQATLVITGP